MKNSLASGVILFAICLPIPVTVFAQAESAEDLKAKFVDAFWKYDEPTLSQTYEQLAITYPQDPELAEFAYELGCLYANAAIE